MSQTLASLRRPIITTAQAARAAIWTVVYAVCLIWTALLCNAVYEGGHSLVRIFNGVALDSQEAFVAAPRGCASCVSLASKETGR